MKLASLFSVMILIFPLFSVVGFLTNASSTDNVNYEFNYKIYRPSYLDEIETNEDPEKEWWERTSMDSDSNGIFDTLDSSTEIYHNIVVDYDHAPTSQDISALINLGYEPSNFFDEFNAVILNEVPKTAFTSILQQDGVVMIEPRGEPAAASDVATPAVKARESDEYSPNTAWELGYSGKGVSVAIMDTGIDDAHPSFTGKWLGGVDFTKPDMFLTPRDGTYNADDTNGHGTTCAGIATGTGAPEGLYMGAAPDARLVDMRIGSTIGYAPGELLQDFYDAALEGAQWAVDHKDDSWQGAPQEYAGIHILSLSWGVDTDGSSDGSDVYSRSLDKCVESGIITIVAAGNSGPNNDGFRGMGSSSLVITIGSTDDQNTILRDDDVIASYSSRGPRKDNNDGYPYNELKPDVSAPGTNIMQAQYDRFGDASSNGYGSRGSGTSYATPNVVGVVALMREANPELTQEVIKEILRLTSERWGPATFPDLDPFWNKDYGWGIIDAYSAVKMSEDIGNVEDIEVDLQCHITNVTDNVDDSDATHAEFTGLAWARIGADFSDVEGIEVTWEKGKWHQVSDFEAVEAGEFINWSFKLDMRDFPKGNHTLYARTITGSGHSLIFAQEFTVIDPPKEEPSAISAGMGLFAAVILIIVVGVAAWMYFKRKKQ